ncbi:MAG: hypothetical protein ACP5NV_06125 [Candidatus Woesearchaeota archaeon]
MQDKTTIYMMIIVGIVALVGIIVMITSPAAETGDAITGNVVYEEYDFPTGDTFGKLIFTLVLAGVAGYMYLKME